MKVTPRDTRCKPQGRMRYRLLKVLIDSYADYLPDDGALVYKTQPHGCPPNGTMGSCYIADCATGKFIGMVSAKSLTPADKLDDELAYGRG